jgi:cold shock protein
MLYGRITRLEPAHGFGFIVDDSGLDWFFVRDGARETGFETLRAGERVRFGHEWTRSGPRAVDVHHEHAG